MATTAPTGIIETSRLDAKLAKGPGKRGLLIFGLALGAGMLYVGSQLLADLAEVREGSARSSASASPTN